MLVGMRKGLLGKINNDRGTWFFMLLAECMGLKKGVERDLRGTNVL